MPVLHPQPTNSDKKVNGGVKSIEESKAERQQRHQARFRDRGGIFVPSTTNDLVGILLSRKFNAESPRKVRSSPRKSKGRASTTAIGSTAKRNIKPETPRITPATQKSGSVVEVNVESSAKVVPKKGTRRKSRVSTASTKSALPERYVSILAAISPIYVGGEGDVADIPKTVTKPSQSKARGIAPKSSKSATARIAEIINLTIPTPVMTKVRKIPESKLLKEEEGSQEDSPKATQLVFQAQHATKASDDYGGTVAKKPASKKAAGPKKTVIKSSVREHTLQTTQGKGRPKKNPLEDGGSVQTKTRTGQSKQSSKNQPSQNNVLSLTQPPSHSIPTATSPRQSSPESLHSSTATTSSASTSRQTQAPTSRATSYTTPESDFVPNRKNQKPLRNPIKSKPKARSAVARGLPPIAETGGAGEVSVGVVEEEAPYSELLPGSDKSVEVPLVEVMKLQILARRKGKEKAQPAVEPDPPARGSNTKKRARKLSEVEEELKVAPAKKRAKSVSRNVGDAAPLKKRNAQRNHDAQEDEAHEQDVPRQSKKRKNASEMRRQNKRARGQSQLEQDNEPSSSGDKENIVFKNAREAPQRSPVKPRSTCKDQT
ncbi:hypothetical protein HETIRDRAFT_428192 [Heterobasidion irregulare TC 32-1]|uniref:Uncharacterized protein n=1 Tax=Heterobasidion irregulare (strain TC 32-1) TaxID=747525 RepID=W4K1T0_HETIT|nr:uncharacterized protein HETIRDRAFT_428192 [Heterobasidion irregulare TC 32-1]ETW79767.1 hypothetical protein HETIRDRAFT_428192 [Heterobasidion irregulare TC 32-1]